MLLLSILGGILNAVSGSDEMAWQQEKVWHEQVYEVFMACTQS